MMNRKVFLQSLFLLFLIVGTVFILKRQKSMPYQNDRGNIFGTQYNITYKHDKKLSLEIRRALQDVDNALSIFNQSSIVSCINRNEDAETNTHFERVFKLAMQVAEETDGAFDPTIAPLVNVWGFGFDTDKQPTSTVIDSLRTFLGYEKISLERHKVLKQDNRTMLDFGAIAKGYACDVIAEVMKTHDIADFMIEIGGEVVTKGHNASGEKWRIGIAKPDESNSSEIQEVINVGSCAMATSGNYRNYYYKNGIKYAHTINPKTGYPVNHSLLSATVIAPICALADAYATAFMVIGIDEAKAFLEKHQHISAYFIYTDENGKYAIWYSPKIKQLLN